MTKSESAGGRYLQVEVPIIWRARRVFNIKQQSGITAFSIETRWPLIAVAWFELSAKIFFIGVKALLDRRTNRLNFTKKEGVDEK